MKRFYALLFSLFTLFLFAAPPQVITSITPAGAVFEVGTTVKFTGKITNGDNVPEGARVFYEEFVDGIRKRTGHIAFDEEISLTRPLTRPGWYSVRLRMVDADNRDIRAGNQYVIGGRGVMVAPEDIRPSGERPDDFDEFWDSRRKLLDAVPVRELERRPVEYSGPFADEVEAFDVRIACAGSKAVSGVLTMPKNAAEKSLPAIVHFQGAGVHSASVTAHYGRVSISLMINANGNENFREREYYDALRRGELRNYWYAGKGDREKFHFHDMFLRVMRALDYVKSLPQWNGRILVVHGGSQGGAQAIVAAAMDPQVTLMISEVPAMCDHNGFLMKVPRIPGWPRLYTNGSDPAVIRTAAYYDMVNFASRVKCESFVSTGMIDFVCSPCGVACVFNALASENKQFLIHLTGDHVGPQREASFRRVWVDRMLAHFKEK